MRTIPVKIDDLKATWASQENEPVYTINDRELQSVLQERSRKLRRTLFSNEIQNYWTSLWIGGFLAYLLWRGYSDISAADPWYFVTLGAAAAVLLYYVLFSIFFVGRRRIQSPKPDFASSLRERLDREIEYLAYQIAARLNWKRVLLHLIPPWSACIVIVSAMTIRSGDPFRLLDVLSIAVVTGGWIHVYWLQRRWVYGELVPRKRELDTLRRKLDEPERHA